MSDWSSLRAGGPMLGTAGAWDLEAGQLPPGARAFLTERGVDPDDVAAVKAYYASADNGDDGLPFFYPDWLARHPD